MFDRSNHFARRKAWAMDRLNAEESSIHTHLLFPVGVLPTRQVVVAVVQLDTHASSLQVALDGVRRVLHGLLHLSAV